MLNSWTEEFGPVADEYRAYAVAAFNELDGLDTHHEDA